MMLKLKLTRILIIGMCLTLGSASAAYASEDITKEQVPMRLPAVASTMIAPDNPVASPANVGQDYNPELLKLQKEVDYFVFEQNRGEFADKGFSVTHTGPMADYVEIGIQPYSEDSAEFLYSKFDKNKVKVVEGQFATTLAAFSGSAEPALDAPLMAEVPAGGEEVLEYQANVVSDNVDRTAEISITSAEGEQAESSNALLYGLGAVVLLGVSGFGVKRVLAQNKK